MATALQTFEEKLPAVAKRGIDESTWLTLKNSVYVGAKDESVLMVLDWCAANGFDPLTQPVHIVPMYVKDDKGKGSMRDVIMQGINTLRIRAGRSCDFAGVSAPMYGPIISEKLGSLDFLYPEWCEVTVEKLIGDRLVKFTGREYFMEAYATAGRDKLEPNAMWKKRPKGQLAKCAEAQALRKAWPEISQQPVYEEMAGKAQEKDITPSVKHNLLTQAVSDEPAEPAQKDDEHKAISKGQGDQIYLLIENAINEEQINIAYTQAIDLCKGEVNRDALNYFIGLCKDKRKALSDVN